MSLIEMILNSAMGIMTNFICLVSLALKLPQITSLLQINLERVDLDLFIRYVLRKKGNRSPLLLTVVHFNPLPIKEVGKHKSIIFT